jgi:hypothetical protein
MSEHSQNVERELAAMIATLDDKPDELHLDITPSVLKLITFGLRGVAAVIDFLNAPRLETRLRAQRVLEGGVGVHMGWKVGQGFPDKTAEQRFRGLVRNNGNYSAHAPEDERKKAMRKWREWLAKERRKTNE